MKKSLRIICFLLAMAICLSVGAFAASNLESISAFLNRGVTVKYNGMAQTFYDANGTRVFPITYNGTTYLPIRAVSNMLGIAVDWDGGTQTVFLGKKPGEVQYLMDVCPPYQTAGNCTVYSLSNGKTFSMSGNTCSNGLVMRSDMFGNDSYALFNFNGQYDTLTFDFGHIDEERHDFSAEYKIYLDGKLQETLYAAPDELAKSYTIDLNGALQMKIETSYCICEYGFSNMVIK